MPLLSAEGTVRKMIGELREGDNTVQYSLPVGSETIALNACLGRTVRLEALGDIYCVHCARRTKTSFSQGYCYPCFTKLPQCDLCIMSPERCHYDQGTCRDPAWGEQFCMSDHIVYLANSSGAKVGITRATQLPTRWIDQGASQALPIMRVSLRRHSGLVEDLLRRQVGDKTNWRALLRGVPDPLNLTELRDTLLSGAREGMDALHLEHGLQAFQPLAEAEVMEIRYPVLEYSPKPKSANLAKEPVLEGTLLGIKGQYLLLDTAVINIRKYTGYNVAFTVH
ncbi:MAG TPA: DUF2797 domain-containing protein [Pseudomonas xinjiangensis]|uniref:DUF2797 domain-containing protein n=2 Tax=root TaxID=1 RepID=A0A7V1BQ94_9GAMM|nr:DUF2797 domain-containing protein [Halopseudomonas xinjiangensis]HEC46182.1 DUF2797 domain-containing protein [Halopseudomonas xinjiangensis]